MAIIAIFQKFSPFSIRAIPSLINLQTFHQTTLSCAFMRHAFQQMYLRFS